MLLRTGGSKHVVADSPKGLSCECWEGNVKKTTFDVAKTCKDMTLEGSTSHRQQRLRLKHIYTVKVKESPLRSLRNEIHRFPIAFHPTRFDIHPVASKHCR